MSSGLGALGGVRLASELDTSSVEWPEQAGQLAGRVLPVAEELAELLPLRGLRRGSTVSVRGSTSLLLAMLATASSNGAWAAVVGMPDLGVLAAAELGVAMRRLAVVPYPGAQAAGVLAALLDGMDLVVVSADCLTGGAGAAGDALADRLARRLSARARHRGAALIAFGRWPGADVRLSVDSSVWSGLGDGHGYLRDREVVLSVAGRGTAARPVRRTVLLPGVTGAVSAVSAAPAGVPTGQRRPSFAGVG